MYARRMQAAQAVDLRHEMQRPDARVRQTVVEMPRDACETPPHTQAGHHAHLKYTRRAEADVVGAPMAAPHPFDAPYNRESIDCIWTLAPVRRAWRALFGAPKRVDM